MVRKELTDEWDKRGVNKGVEYAILTDEITKAWSGMTTRQYKNHKGLKKENRKVAIEGGEAAGEARMAVEKRTGKPVVTSKNAAQLQDLVTGIIESVNDKNDNQEEE